MGTHRVSRFATRIAIFSLVVSSLVAGCQLTTVPQQAMVEHHQQINASDLDLPIEIQPLKAHVALPAGWFPLGLQKATLYSHCQWRSPTKRTAVGITHVPMLLPLSTKALVWMAMGEITKRVNDGKIIRQWTDEVGRQWFEAENSKYHLTGYVMTRGFDAWINYSGYRVGEPKEESEVALAIKSLDTILPLSVAQAAQLKTASAQ
ncbi:MAG TPA: hypothetical protein VHP11_02860 [Tepidisphaeraceae bacterium]|nr:hypothetical protein [Tepidisphaeraceae bacterium]